MNLRRRRRGFVVPLSSMSDVAFLLLIFIMLVSLINYRKTVPIDYAEAASARKTAAERNLEIWVDREGGLYLDGEKCDLGLLETAVTETLRERPDTRIHVIADRAVPFEAVSGVLAILQKMRHRLVSFVVKNE